eukprot:365743-Chlamydomonas_euryale.AAC.41
MTGSAPGMASSSSAAGGTDTAMALNVPSTLPSLSTLRNALTRSSPTPPEDWQADVTSPAADAAALYSRSSSFFSRRCPDSQRLNGSESCANRKSSCSSPCAARRVAWTGVDSMRRAGGVAGAGEWVDGVWRMWWKWVDGRVSRQAVRWTGGWAGLAARLKKGNLPGREVEEGGWPGSMEHAIGRQDAFLAGGAHAGSRKSAPAAAGAGTCAGTYTQTHQLLP